MKIIVTGAIGHIGSYIIRDLGLFFPDSKIVMIDNMMTQRFPNAWVNIYNPDRKFVKFLKTQTKEMTALMKKLGVI